MPQLGETVTEGTITKWHKQVGDAVAEDEVLFEVSTDKVDSEVPSPVSGTVTEILVPEGETVSVGTKLAVIGQAGDAAGARLPAARRRRRRTAEDGAAQAAEVTDSAVAEPVEVLRRRPSWKPERARARPGQRGSAEEPDAEEQAGGGRRPAGQGAPAPAKPPTGGPARPGVRPADQRPPAARLRAARASSCRPSCAG